MKKTIGFVSHALRTLPSVRLLDCCEQASHNFAPFVRAGWEMRNPVDLCFAVPDFIS